MRVIPRETSERQPASHIGNADGSIMATIIASHIDRNIATDAAQVCPGIRIHIMDIVQPPGMAIPPDIERQK